MAKKLYYKIGEACKRLDIQPYVLRYWETEFPLLDPSKSTSGQRVYSDQDLRVIQRIKELLYEEGYTIAGAKKKLEKEDLSSLGEVRRPLRAAADESEPEESEEPEELEPEATLETVAAESGDEPAAEPEPPAPKASSAPRAPRPETKTRPRPKPVPKAPAPDRSAAEARLQRGIREALKEARAILEILDTA